MRCTSVAVVSLSFACKSTPDAGEPREMLGFKDVHIGDAGFGRTFTVRG